MYLYITRMPLICTRILSDPYGTCMYSYVIRISLICTRLSSVCHSFVLACNPHGARIYSYVIRMSLMYCFTMRVTKLYTLGVSVLHLVTISYFGLFSFDGQLSLLSSVFSKLSQLILTIKNKKLVKAPELGETGFRCVPFR